MGNSPTQRLESLGWCRGSHTNADTDKTRKSPKCGDCGTKLAGICAVAPAKMRRLAKRQRTVARAYGGSRCHTCVRKRIVRAFLIEEQKIVKDVQRQNKSKAGKKK